MKLIANQATGGTAMKYIDDIVTVQTIDIDPKNIGAITEHHLRGGSIRFANSCYIQDPEKEKIIFDGKIPWERRSLCKNLTKEQVAEYRERGRGWIRYNGERFRYAIWDLRGTKIKVSDYVSADER